MMDNGIQNSLLFRETLFQTSVCWAYTVKCYNHWATINSSLLQKANNYAQIFGLLHFDIDSPIFRW